MALNYPYLPNYTNFNAYNPQPAPQMPANNNSIVWVQGEAGAKSYLVGAGNSVLLMDAEDSVFYIKSTDNSGMPLPLRIFEYTERTANAQNTAKMDEPVKNNYVTREELEERLKEITEPKTKRSVNNG